MNKKPLFSILSLNVNQIERVHDTTTTIDRLRYLIKALLFGNITALDPKLIKIRGRKKDQIIKVHMYT